MEIGLENTYRMNGRDDDWLSHLGDVITTYRHGPVKFNKNLKYFSLLLYMLIALLKLQQLTNRCHQHAPQNFNLGQFQAVLHHACNPKIVSSSQTAFHSRFQCYELCLRPEFPKGVHKISLSKSIQIRPKRAATRIIIKKKFFFQLDLFHKK